MFFASNKVREANNLPEGWQAYKVGVIGSNGSHVQLDGGVYPECWSKGPRKGTPNYRKPQPGTERTVILTMAEYREMVKIDAARTTDA